MVLLGEHVVDDDTSVCKNKIGSYIYGPVV